MPDYDYYALSEAGQRRSTNQDRVFAKTYDITPETKVGLFVVAHGMRSHPDGGKACELAIDVVEWAIQKLMMSESSINSPVILEGLRSGVEEANQRVWEEIPAGTCTLTAAVVVDDFAHLAHVGNTRAYLIAQDGIKQITRDHSLVQRLVELDTLTPEEGARHPQRNVLYRFVGQGDDLVVDTSTCQLPPRAYLLLCSDGLWRLVADQTIWNNVLKQDNPQEACIDLMNLANEQGGTDNVSIILLKER